MNRFRCGLHVLGPLRFCRGCFNQISCAPRCVLWCFVLCLLSTQTAAQISSVKWRCMLCLLHPLTARPSVLCGANEVPLHSTQLK